MLDCAFLCLHIHYTKEMTQTILYCINISDQHPELLKQMKNLNAKKNPRKIFLDNENQNQNKTEGLFICLKIMSYRIRLHACVIFIL